MIQTGPIWFRIIARNTTFFFVMLSLLFILINISSKETLQNKKNHYEKIEKDGLSFAPKKSVLKDYFI